jgi:hypothetical protein
VFIHSGFDAADKLDIDGFTKLIQKNYELAHFIKGAMRNEIWSEKYRYKSETSSEGSNLDTKNTAPNSQYSKASVLDMFKFDAIASKSKSKLNLEVYNSNKLDYITHESDTGPIDLYTSKIPAVKKGYLMKLRSHCGDFIKRFYYLKNNILYFYG